MKKKRQCNYSSFLASLSNNNTITEHTDSMGRGGQASSLTPNCYTVVNNNHNTMRESNELHGIGKFQDQHSISGQGLNKRDWAGNFGEPTQQSEVHENQFPSDMFEQGHATLQGSCSEQRRKRPYTCTDSTLEDRRKRLDLGYDHYDQYGQDGNLQHPEPSKISCHNQILSQGSCNQGRKRPFDEHFNNVENRSMDISSHMAKKIRLSDDTANQALNIDFNWQSNNNKHCTKGSKPTSDNINRIHNIANNQNMQASGTDKLVTYNLAITTNDYPTSSFKWNQFDAVQMAVFEKLETSPDPLPVVSLGNINPIGVIPVTCKGRNSANFLYSFNGQIVRGNLKLKVVDASDLPKPVKMIWISQKVWCKDLARVLRMLQRCNSGLQTAFWRVVVTNLKAQFVRRVVYVDCVSAEYIKSKNYSIPDGLGKSKFKIINVPKSSSVPTTYTSSLDKETQHEKVEIPRNSYQNRNNEYREQLQPSELLCGDGDFSLMEIREPVVTIDLTSDNED